MSDFEFLVTDLPNNLLGLAASHLVWIDRDAAGFGWFVDPTPSTDEEFSADGHQNIGAQQVDLLTVLAHELGHLLGFEHDSAPGHLMSESLAPGTDFDQVFANPEWP